MRRNKYITIIFLVCLAGKSLSQTFNNDARLWLYLKFDKDVADKWNLHLLLQNRFNNNVSEYSQGYSDIGITFKINKKIRLVADYVYGGQRRLDGSYTRIHQAYTGVLFRQKINRFQLIARILLQAQVSNVYSSEKGRVPKLYERSKLTLKYDINKRLSCYVAEEINCPFYRFSQIYINRSRSFAGLNYELSKKNSIEAYFLLQRQLTYKNQPNRDFIYGLTYSHSF